MFTSRTAHDEAAAVLARRAGRIAFGLVLSAGMIAFAWLSLADPQRSSVLAHAIDAHRGSCESSVAILEVTWFAAVASYLVVRLGVRRIAPAPRGDALLRAGLVVPAIGLALALPLGLHLVLFLIFGASFDSWADASVRVVGIAHLAFAVTFAIRAAALARTSTPKMSIETIYGASVAASMVPFGIFVLPEVLTALTGVAVLPVLRWFDRLAAREREALPRLPAARVQSIA